MRRGDGHPDLAEALQARLCSNRDAEQAAADERSRVEGLEAHVTALETAVVRTEALSNQRQHEAETALKRVRALKAYIATREVAVAKADADSRQRQHEAETAAKRVGVLAACRT
jgi:hypothetical protein